MESYQQLVQRVLRDGEPRQNRTGVSTSSVFGGFWSHDLIEKGFPLLTTKKILYSSVVRELLWFLRGETNTQTLGTKIWDSWADDHGELGPIYGAQWRRFQGVRYETQEVMEIDQLAWVIDQLRLDPTSRRLIVTSWNPPQLDQMGLPPCHFAFQLSADPERRRLSLMFYQRSVDLFIGFPFNIASYATLLHIIARIGGYTPHRICASLGDVHLYDNHRQQAELILSRCPYSLPRLEIQREVRGVDDLAELSDRDFVLQGYRHHGFIPAPIAA